MNKSNTKSRSKITVRIWTPILDAFVARTDTAFLRRDLLITNTLKLELPRIRNELPHKNSELARRFIEANLRRLFTTPQGATQISLALDPAVAKALESVCEEKNIPREALLNRLLVLLGAPAEFLRKYFFEFFVSYEVDAITRDEAKETIDMDVLASDIAIHDAASNASFELAFSPLGRIVEVASDPIRRYRELLQTVHELRYPTTAEGDQSMAERYRYAFTPFGAVLEDDLLVGLNCYLEDAVITSDEAADLLQGTKKDQQTTTEKQVRPSSRGRRRP